MEVELDDHEEGHEEEMPMPMPMPVRSMLRYGECLKNHAVGSGGHAVDGCGEFIAAGEDGTVDALRCAACGCHRSFHRREEPEFAGAEVSPFSPVAVAAYGAVPLPHHQFSPYHRTPAVYLHHHHQHMAAAAAAAAGPMTAVAPQPLSIMSPGGAGPSGSKKRFRTKFTEEQKAKMLAFAERLGWRVQKRDAAAVEQFCDEVSVKRHVLKVWMHNNKLTLGKKP